MPNAKPREKIASSLEKLQACANQTMNAPVCKACGHAFCTCENCYLRGPPFQPEDARQCIKRFNNEHGDAPKTQLKSNKACPLKETATNDSGLRQ